MIKCSKCGTENKKESNFCINCGAKIIVETGRRNPTAHKSPITNSSGGSTGELAVGKTPVLACILSVLIVGLGQFYNGDTKKGAIMLGAAVLLGVVSAGIVWLALAVYSAYDAYQVASGKKALGAW